MRLKDSRNRGKRKKISSWEEESPTPRYRQPKSKNRGKLKTFVLVTPHCVERFIEIIPEVENVEFEKVRGMILAMYRDGCLFGGQYGDDFLIRSKHRHTERELVFACTTEKQENQKITIIKTTLSMDHASGNMQQREMKNPDVSLDDMM